MSLSGIFEPIVNAYFKKKYGGSGGGESNFKYRILSNPKEAVEFVTQDGMVMQKVSEYFPVKFNERNEAGFYLFSDPTDTSISGGRIGGVGSIAQMQVVIEEGMEIWSATVGDTPFLTAFDQEALDILKQDPDAAESMPPEPGAWLMFSFLETYSDWAMVFYE